MKKRLLVLGIIICMLGLTACGSTAADENLYVSNEEATQVIEYYGLQASQLDLATIEMMETQYQQSMPYERMAVEGYEASKEELGAITELKGIETNTLLADFSEGTIDALVSCENRDANIEIVVDKGTITSISFNPVYTFAEGMEKATLNTLLGMGTVFVVLILISLLISAFNLIPKVQAVFSKKPQKEGVKTKAVDNTIAQIIEKEELSDDLELVAVIAAAVAASQGASSTDGFVVRSIRKHNRFN